jgi:hypothetical protein
MQRAGARARADRRDNGSPGGREQNSKGERLKGREVGCVGSEYGTDRHGQTDMDRQTWTDRQDRHGQTHGQQTDMDRKTNKRGHGQYHWTERKKPSLPMAPARYRWVDGGITTVHWGWDGTWTVGS